MNRVPPGDLGREGVECANDTRSGVLGRLLLLLSLRAAQALARASVAGLSGREGERDALLRFIRLGVEGCAPAALPANTSPENRSRGREGKKEWKQLPEQCFTTMGTHHHREQMLRTAVLVPVRDQGRLQTPCPSIFISTNATSNR
jgi:hypothetical protein